MHIFEKFLSMMIEVDMKCYKTMTTTQKSGCTTLTTNIHQTI